MRKLLALFICVSLVFSLIACNNQHNESFDNSQAIGSHSFGASSLSSYENQSSINEPSSSSEENQSSSGGQNVNDEFLVQDEVIKSFLISARDIDTVTSFDSVANESSATYADVPDYYLNLDNPSATDIFASASGLENGDGSKTNPYDIYTALSKLSSGKTLYLLEGEYNLSKRINFYTSGTRTNYVNIYAYQGKKVVLNFSAMEYGSDNKGMALYANYVRIYGIDFKGAGDNGMTIIGDYNIVENCRFYDNQDTGLQIMGNGSDFTAWPHDNLILNCTAFNNADIEEGNDQAIGENADGFACKLANGNNNTFDGCIAYNNIDDGWDLYAQNQANGRTILVNSIAFNNGYLLDGTRTPDADGNGFKLGSSLFPSNSLVENCVAFDNYDNGFTCNCNVGALEIYNCTAYNNSLKGVDEACNFNLGRSGYDCSQRFLSNLLSLSSNTCFDKATGTIRNSLFTLNAKGYYFITSVDKLEKTAVETYGTKKDFSTNDLVESVDFSVFGSDYHSTLRNKDLSVNLKTYLKVNKNSQAFILGENNTCLGAKLHSDNYLTLEVVEGLANEIGTPERSSQSFKKIYKAVKGYCSLSLEDRQSFSNRQTLIDAISVYNQTAKRT